MQHTKSGWLYLLAVSDSIGIGHLKRCLRIAASLPKLEHQFVVATDWSPERVSELMRQHKPCCVGLDGSGVSDDDFVDKQIVVDFPEIPPWARRAATGASRSLVLGSSAIDAACADLVVNVAQGGPLTPRAVEIEGQIRQLEGAAFAMLPTALKPGIAAPDHLAESNLLVVFGGTDAGRMTLPTAEALVGESSLGIPVVVASDRHRDWTSLRSLHDQEKIALQSHTPELPRLICESRAVITAPGNILFECLAANTPAIAIAANSRQANDFATYPWLLREFSGKSMMSRLVDLLASERDLWLDFANRAQAGRLASVVTSWMQNPNHDLHNHLAAELVEINAEP